MAFTKEQLALIHQDIRVALEAVATKHNLSQGHQRITYSDSGFSVKCEFGAKSVIGDVDPSLFDALRRHGWKFGLKIEDSNKATFVSMGKTYTIIGMKGYTRVIAKDASGKRFSFNGADVKRVMGR